MKNLKEKDLNQRIFVCDEESNFYSFCLESLVLRNNINNKNEIIEFGSGDGMPVINALLRNNFKGIIQGFEINSEAVIKARNNISNTGISNNYVIYEKSFFDFLISGNYTLISNPPYLPAHDNDLRIPALHGGKDGNNLSKKLLERGFYSVMLMVSSYSNPVSIINYAKSLGYCIADFLIMPMPFGFYSSEPKVLSRIAEMKIKNEAFFSEKRYLLAGVLFSSDKVHIDLTDELLNIITGI